ncbi:MAG: hypothetical protein ACTSVY_00080 [Candidatus Helarchaeota archaeon]
MAANTGIPFITSIANDIYDRVDKLATTLQKIPGILSKITEGFQENLDRLNHNIDEMLKESKSNRDLTLDAFGNSLSTLSQKIKEIKEENEKNFKDPQMKELIERLDKIATKLSTSYWDINIILIVNSIHWIVDILKGNLKRVDVPAHARTALRTFGNVPSSKAAKPVTLSSIKAEEERAVLDSKESQDARAFSHGKRVKTHDDHMKEIERRRKLFGKY